MVKHILSKAKSDNKDLYISLLEYRTTALNIGYSPSQLLMGPSLWTLLPVSNASLRPQSIQQEIAHDNMLNAKEKGKSYYDQGSKPLPKIAEGDTVRIRQNGKRQPAQCVQEHNNRSFSIQTPEGGIYRRNRKDLLKTNEKFEHNVTPTDRCDISSLPSNSLEESSPDLPPPCTPTSPPTPQPYVIKSGRTVKPKIIPSM